MADLPNVAPPSLDPADADSMLGMARMVLQKFLQGVDDMLPAIVVSYDRTKNRAKVRPLIRMVTTDGRQVGRAPLAAVPVFSYGGGGFTLNFPLKAGDLGWIKANDRDISLMLQGGKESPPNTKRLHSFQDAVFIPDVMKGYAIAGEDADNVVLQSLDGTVKVAVGAAGLKLAAGGMSMTMTTAGTVFVGPVTIGGVVMNSHKHPGVQTGAGSTGGPVT